MPSKKKKYNARFPAGRIKKIMQSDEEIGKVAQAVPVIISRTLELFVESLLTKTLKITNSRSAKTLSTSHMKQCIMSEQRFDFLRELVKNIPDISVAEEAFGYNDDEAQSSPEEQYPDSDTPYDLSMPSTSTRALSRGAPSNGNSAPAAAEYIRSYSFNGTNYNNNNTSSASSSGNCLLRETEIMMRLQQRIDNNCSKSVCSTNTGNNSVIMHTTSLASVDCEQMPAKLSRSESTPASPNSHNFTQRQQQRLKKQAHSLPNSCRSPTTTATTSTTEANNTKCLQSNEQQPQAYQPTAAAAVAAAIPAPIVSYVLNKPIVKIDYSNIQIPTTSAGSNHITPMSAPANIDATQSLNANAFNFNTEPVINIDLSNIVPNVAASTPAIATISIGSLPTELSTASSTTTSTTNSKSIAAQLTPNSKAKMAAPFKKQPSSSSNTAAIPKAATLSNSFFELDEDYDNI